MLDSEVLTGKGGGPGDKINIPTELLRTFVAIYELGSFTKAARLFELTQPAISAHMKKLEALIGSALLEKYASRVKLTERGAAVLKYARRILSINDQIVSAGTHQRLARTIRLGIPNVFASIKLKEILKECRAPATDIGVQICCDHSPGLVRSIASGYLDLAVAMDDADNLKNAVRSWTEELVWVRSRDFVLVPGSPVPLVSSPNLLLPDRVAIEALGRAKQRHEIVFTAFDHRVRRAAVAAGLGYLALLRVLVPPDLVKEPPGILPELPRVTIGIIAREELDIAELKPLIATVERIVTSAR